jgi:hypothetical protein
MPEQKILLLENVAAQAAGVRERLGLAGFQVAVSRYEADGLRRLREWQPDLVLLSTAHPAGNLVEYCREARSLAPAARIVLTSSLNRERLFQEHPALASLVEGVLLRPYSFDEVAALVRAPAPAAAPAVVTAAAAPVPARVVAVTDRDPGTVVTLRETLATHGVEVVHLPLDGIAAFCREYRPAALVLEWPLSDGFISGTLAALRSRPGAAPLSVFLLSGAAQEAVSQAAPQLMHLVDMFFRKPVAWEHFFRVLGRTLAIQETIAYVPVHAPAPATQPQPPPAPEPAAPDAEQEMRARFQSQLEAKFLEVEELKRRLESAAGTGPGDGQPELEQLRAEAAQLRRAVEEGRKRAELAVAMERLKSSEVEVKLDNLLRMKDEFERRAQDELEAGERERERLRAELEGLTSRFAALERERAGLHGTLEQALVEKEQLEERLHRGEARPAGAAAAPDGAASLAPATPAAAADPAREAALEAEIAHLRGQAAEAAVALAELAARAAKDEESLARERETRGEAETRLRAEARAETTRAEVAAERVRVLEAERGAREERIAALLAERDALRERSGAVQAERDAAQERVRTLEAERESAVALATDLGARLGAAEEALGRERAGRAADAAGARSERTATEERIGTLQAQLAAAAGAAASVDAVVAALRAKVSGLETELAGLRERAAGLEREVAERAAQPAPDTTGAAEELARLREAVALKEQERLAAVAGREEEALRSAAAEGRLTEEVRVWRGKAEEATLALARLRAQAEELEGRVEVQSEEASRLRAAHAAALGLRDAELAAIREAREAREAALQEQLRAERDAVRALEGRLAAASVSGSAGVQEELGRQRLLLEEVIARARTESLEHARREIELDVRLQASLEDRRELRERLERALAEGAERERRSAALLQSALARGAEGPRAGAAEPDNLPAIVPVPEEGAAEPQKRRTGLLIALAAAAAVAAVIGLATLRGRPTAPTAVEAPREHATTEAPAPITPGSAPTSSKPADHRTVAGKAPGGRPAAPAPPVAPREVWERWTRSDVSGGVLLQATLRSEEEVRAEVDAEREARAWTPERAGAEVARALGRYRFGERYYFYLYIKSLVPGYPPWLEEAPAHFTLRDDRGQEVAAAVPEGLEHERTVRAFGGELARGGGERVYEATLPLAFPRAGLASRPSYLQLVIRDVGASTRRVLTWELQ